MDWLAAQHNILIILHVGSVIATLLIVIGTDIYASLWVLGRRQTLSLKRLHKLHRIVWIGLGATMIAGLGLFLPYADFLVTDPAFQLKMLFLFFLIVNAVVIGKHIAIAATRPFAELAPKERWPLILSGLVSTTSWLGALIAAQFIAL